MERDSRYLSGAESTSGGSNEKDKIASSHRIDKSEVELPDSESVETISAPRTSLWGAKDSRNNRKKTGQYFADLSYINSLSRQERRRIEGEMIKGRKPGDCNQSHNNRSTHDIAGVVYVLKKHRAME